VRYYEASAGSKLPERYDEHPGKLGSEKHGNELDKLLEWPLKELNQDLVVV
jgi:hypothetical protein